MTSVILGVIGSSVLDEGGSNSGDVTLAAVGSTPAAEGASLSAQVLTLQPADATHPGVVTIGTQTIAGAKTLSGATALSGGATVSGADLNIVAAQAINTNSMRATSGGRLTLYDHLGLTGNLTLSSFTNSSGTPGAATINKACGRSSVAVGAQTAVITNSYVQAGDIVLCQLETAGSSVGAIIPTTITAGSFTVTSVVGTGAATNVATAAAVFSWVVIRTS